MEPAPWGNVAQCVPGSLALVLHVSTKLRIRRVSASPPSGGVSSRGDSFPRASIKSKGVPTGLAPWGKVPGPLRASTTH